MKKRFLFCCLFSLAAPALYAGGEGLSLARARSLALAQNPAFLSLQQEAEAAQGRLRAAGGWGAATLAFEREDFGASGPEGMPQPVETLALSVPLPLGGKRGAARAAGRAGVHIAEAEIEAARRDLLAEVEVAFGEAVGARDRLALAQENLETATRTADAVGALVEAGEVSPIEADRAAVELSRGRIAREAASRAKSQSYRRLASLMGLMRPDFEEVEGSLPETAHLPAEPTSLEGHPLLRKLSHAEEGLAAETHLAKRGWWPEPELTFGARRYDDPGGHAFVAGFALSLPSPSQTVGAVLEAQARERQGMLARREGELRLHADLLSARAEVEGALAEATSLREDALPLARTVYEAFYEGYGLGRFGLLDLLEAQRTLQEVKAEYIDALVALNNARAEWERLVPPSPSPETGVTP